MPVVRVYKQKIPGEQRTEQQTERKGIVEETRPLNSTAKEEQNASTQMSAKMWTQTAQVAYTVFVFDMHIFALVV